jgi:twinkle protein
MTPKLGPAGVAALEERKIEPETIERFGIYTAKRVKRGDDFEMVPDLRGNVIVFPFLDHGTIVNEKYRQLPWEPRKAWQRPSGRQTFWNADALDDPALADGRMPLVITEGEIDALTAIDCGFPLTVSVPAGAPSVPKGRDPEDLDPLDPQTEATGKFEFLYLNRERLKLVKRFVIAVDADGPGKRLAAELVRRLSPSRCMFLTWPTQKRHEDEECNLRACKDLNEVRKYFGPEGVVALLNGAKPYPVHGLYRLNEFPDLPEIRTHKTGWWTLDNHFKPFLGELAFVLGIPGMGKSVFIANLLVNLSEAYGWRAAIFTPEEPVVPHFRAKLRRIYLRRDPLALDHEAIAEADAWLNDRFVFIAADPLGQTDQEVYLDWLLDRANDAVIRDGVQILVIDPWNEIEHARQPRENQTEYISRAIRAINRFRHQHQVMVIVAIHPTKEVGKDGKSRWPTPYDADGSAAWFNKADHFLIVHRQDDALEQSSIRVAKVKFEGTGRKGTVHLKFESASNRYELLDAPIEQDNRP